MQHTKEGRVICDKKIDCDIRGKQSKPSNLGWLPILCAYLLIIGCAEPTTFVDAPVPDQKDQDPEGLLDSTDGLESSHESKSLDVSVEAMKNDDDYVLASKPNDEELMEGSGDKELAEGQSNNFDLEEDIDEQGHDHSHSANENSLPSHSNIETIQSISDSLDTESSDELEQIDGHSKKDLIDDMIISSGQDQSESDNNYDDDTLPEPVKDDDQHKKQEPILSDNEQSIDDTQVDSEQTTDNPEQVICTSSAAMAIWTDKNSDGSIEGENFLGYTKNFEGQLSASQNYNYYSYSAHPIIGPAPSGFHSNIFFYRDSKGLHFNFFHNIDEGGSEFNEVHWEIKVTGNQGKDRVVLSDDGDELQLVSTFGDTNIYNGDFNYWKNTDGGIIGPLVNETFLISVKYINNGDLANIAFYSQGGDTIQLTANTLESDSFIITPKLTGEICNHGL